MPPLSPKNVKAFESDLKVIRDEEDTLTVKNVEKKMGKSSSFADIFKFEQPLKWINVIFIILWHILAVVGFCCFRFDDMRSVKTVLFSCLIGFLAGFGVTGGAHRFWTHRSYKANLPLRIILMICYGFAGQNTLYDWVRDHRVHHKFSETSADPHDANRGFFFSHVGWLMMKKNPEVIKKGNSIDMSDITSDPVVQFHLKYFLPLKIMLCFVLPTLVPVYFWDETWANAIISQPLVRYILSLNFTWSVNSVAHLIGNKPYDKNIMPSENRFVSWVALGEGWHNYHHAFPSDYKAAELGDYFLNYTTFVLNQFAKIGWAYDLKEPSKELVRKVVLATGDGTHPVYGKTKRT